MTVHSALRGGRNLKSVFRQFTRGYAAYSKEVNTIGVGGALIFTNDAELS